MSFKSHARKFASDVIPFLVYLSLYGMVIWPPDFLCCIFMGLLIIGFVSVASLVLFSIMITLTGGERADLYVFVYP